MLTPRGESQSRVAGAALARMEPGFEAILFSPKVRARRTAELAAAEWGQDARSLLSVHPSLAGGFDAGQALDLLSGLSADAHLLLVGHEPDLSKVISELTGARADIKKAGLAIVRLEGAGGELTVLMRPRELALIAGAPLGGE